MSAAPRNDEVTCIDAFVTGINSLTDLVNGTDVPAVPQGCDVVPGDRLETWIDAPEASKPRHIALVRLPPTPVEHDAPVSRVQMERFNLGFVVMVRRTSDHKRNWRDALVELIDLYNRCMNQIETDAATLRAAGTISPLTDGDALIWEDEIDPGPLPVEWLAQGRRFTLGNQVGGARTH